MALGYRLFGRHDRRRYALKLLNVILGENMSSRLFQNLRERRGLVYAVNSSVTLYDDTGVLGVTADLDPRKCDRAFAVMAADLRRLREQPPSARELNRAKEYVIGQMRLGLESPARRMMWCGESEIGFGRLVSPADEEAAFQAVTRDGLAAVAARALRPSAASLAVVGPGMTDEAGRRFRAKLD